MPNGCTSLYIHWPFCEKKCPYCDFNSHVSDAIDEEAFIRAFEMEIDFFVAKFAKKVEISTIFFGGGTPSLMSVASVSRLINYVARHNGFFLSANAEITLEANPSSSEAKKFQDFRSAGVNRLSIGVQALDDNSLRALGRLHSAEAGLSAIELACKIFPRYSFDLIYAREGQVLSAWEAELDDVLRRFHPHHVSLYTLTIEKGTPFFAAHARGEVVLPQNVDEFYHLTNQITAAHGLSRYEISNYSTPGNECLHNQNYWQSGSWIGVGPGAHGRLTLDYSAQNSRTNGAIKGRLATQNLSRPDVYLAKIAEKGYGLQSEVELSGEDVAAEVLPMGLRARNGVNISKFASQTGIDLMQFVHTARIEILVQNGLATFIDGHLRLTDRGLDGADSAVEFIIKL